MRKFRVTFTKDIVAKDVAEAEGIAYGLLSGGDDPGNWNLRSVDMLALKTGFINHLLCGGTAVLPVKDGATCVNDCCKFALYDEAYEAELERTGGNEALAEEFARYISDDFDLDQWLTEADEDDLEDNE